MQVVQFFLEYDKKRYKRNKSRGKWFLKYYEVNACYKKMYEEAKPISTIENQMDEGNHLTNVSALKINHSSKATMIFLATILVPIQSNGNNLIK